MKTTARQKTLLHKSWKQHLGKAACRPDRLAVRSFKFREHWADWKTKWSSMIVFSIIQKSMPMIRFTFFFVFCCFPCFLLFWGVSKKFLREDHTQMDFTEVCFHVSAPFPYLVTVLLLSQSFSELKSTCYNYKW